MAKGDSLSIAGGDGDGEEMTAVATTVTKQCQLVVTGSSKGYLNLLHPVTLRIVDRVLYTSKSSVLNENVTAGYAKEDKARLRARMKNAGAVHGEAMEVVPITGLHSLPGCPHMVAVAAVGACDYNLILIIDLFCSFTIVSHTLSSDMYLYSIFRWFICYI